MNSNTTSFMSTATLHRFGLFKLKKGECPTPYPQAPNTKCFRSMFLPGEILLLLYLYSVLLTIIEYAKIIYYTVRALNNSIVCCTAVTIIMTPPSQSLFFEHPSSHPNCCTQSKAPLLSSTGGHTRITEGVYSCS